MPAVGITNGPPGCCARDHRAVVLSCSHLARRWTALERRLAWLVIDTQVKVCSRETHSPSRASKIYGNNAFQITHLHTTVINSGRAHTPHRTHCGAALGSRDEIILGIPMGPVGPMGFPWEWESLG